MTYLRDSVEWNRKSIVAFSALKIQLALFDQSNNSGGVGVKMGGFVLEEKSSFKMLGIFFSSKLDWGSHIISIPKRHLQKSRSLDSFYEVFFS